MTTQVFSRNLGYYASKSKPLKLDKSDFKFIVDVFGAY